MKCENSCGKLLNVAVNCTADHAVWTAERVEFELRRFEPVLKQLGLKTPMERARQLVAMEKNWSNSDVQKRWQSRVDYWRTVLLGEGDGALDRILDLDHPRLAQYKLALASEKADQQWASYMRQRNSTVGHLLSRNAS